MHYTGKKKVVVFFTQNKEPLDFFFLMKVL